MNMKTKVLLFALLSGFVFSVAAQEYQPQVGFSTETGAKTNFKKNRTRDNWFISIAGGVSTLFADETTKADFKDRLNFAPQFSFGKWLSPYAGFRTQVIGGNIHGYRGPEKGRLQLLHNKYVGFHMDMLWDVSNYWAPYSEDRVFHLIPWIGIGYAHRFKNQGFKASDVPTMNAGILTAFRLAKRVDFNIEIQGLLAPDYFNRIETGAEWEGIVQLSAGFTFRLGRTDFEVIQPMDEGLINNLNNQINTLRAQNQELSKRPVSCPECPEIVESTEVITNILDNIVLFRINSAEIDGNQQVNIYNTAQFVKDTNTPIVVVGYADKDTGTAEYNMQLSERRAKAVAKELMERYNIPSNMITVQWKGSDVQPYEQNNWNRVVIMQAGD